MAFGIPVGADALIGPFHRLPSTTRPAAAKREAIQCDDHPQRPGHYPPRDGSIDLAEGDSVPEGQPKSEQAPIRRPPSRAEGHCTGARTSAFFSSTGRGAFSFWARPKREWGGASCMDNAPAGADTPEAAVAAAHRPRRPEAFLDPHLHALRPQISLQFFDIHLPGVENRRRQPGVDAGVGEELREVLHLPGAAAGDDGHAHP